MHTHPQALLPWAMSCNSGDSGGSGGWDCARGVHSHLLSLVILSGPSPVLYTLSLRGTREKPEMGLQSSRARHISAALGFKVLSGHISGARAILGKGNVVKTMVERPTAEIKNVYIYND